MSDYDFIVRYSEYLVSLNHSHYGYAGWNEVVLRKEKPCAVCRKLIEVGVKAFSPITNKTFRSDRICIPCIEKMEGK